MLLPRRRPNHQQQLLRKPSRRGRIVKRSQSNDGGHTGVVGNRRDKFDGHPALPGCFKKEKEPNLALLDISDLGTQFEHPGGRAKDE